MKNLQTILWLFPLTVGLLACRTEAKTDVQNKTGATQIQSVAVIPVQSLHPSKPVVLPGELKPWNKVSIHPKVKGFIRSILVDRGSQVKKGQVLAVLDAPEVLAELSQAKAQWLAAEASLSEQTTRYQANQLTYQRLQRTSQTAGAVSLNELDQARAHLRGDSAMAHVARGNAQAAQAFFQAKTQLAHYLTITAPFDGIITERNSSPGALVGTSEAGNTRPIFVLEDNTTLRLTLAVPENLSGEIPAQPTVTFTVTAVPAKQFTARYARSSRSLQEESRSMMAEFDVDNHSDELKAGMYAEVNLPIKRSTATLFVPTTAVVSSSQQVFVIRLRENKAEWVPVKRGNAVENLVEVFGDIQVGDVVVQQASEELRNGQPLRAAKPPVSQAN
jgi:RND family efflux transporter MFP subunit